MKHNSKLRQTWRAVDVDARAGHRQAPGGNGLFLNMGLKTHGPSGSPLSRTLRLTMGFYCSSLSVHWRKRHNFIEVDWDRLALAVHDGQSPC